MGEIGRFKEEGEGILSFSSFLLVDFASFFTNLGASAQIRKAQRCYVNKLNLKGYTFT